MSKQHQEVREALELLRLFAEIKNPDDRRELIEIARKFVETPSKTN